jgi:hypothetical protein
LKGPGAQSRNLLRSARGLRFVTSPRWSKSENDENL